jgi:hypothetical protein
MPRSKTFLATKVECFGHAAVDRGAQQRFDDLVRGEADVQGGVAVDVAPGLAAAERGEHAQGDQLPVAARETRAVVDVAEGPGEDLVAALGRDAGRGVDDLLAAPPRLCG